MLCQVLLLCSSPEPAFAVTSATETESALYLLLLWSCKSSSVPITYSFNWFDWHREDGAAALRKVRSIGTAGIVLSIELLHCFTRIWPFLVVISKLC